MTDIPPPLDTLWFRLLVGLIVGLALGSFVTMLSYRLPRRISVIKPSSSFCPKCKTPLKARDLVPVVSWVVNGGKCRRCGKKISARYPLIELATATGSMLSLAMFGFQPLTILALTGVVAIVTAVTIRIER